MRTKPFVVAALLFHASATFAAEPMAPNDIQATFFNGLSGPNNDVRPTELASEREWAGAGQRYGHHLDERGLAAERLEVFSKAGVAIAKW